MSPRDTIIPLYRAALFAVALPSFLSAQSDEPTAAPALKVELGGDWSVRLETDRGPRTALLSFSKLRSGTYAGTWIDRRGVSQLSDVALDGSRLTFTRQRRGRDGRSTEWRFAGSIAADRVSGTLSADGQTRPLEGRRIAPLPDIVGDWAMSYGRDADSRDRVSLALAVRVDTKGELTARWRTAKGDEPVTKLELRDDGKLVVESVRYGNYKGALKNRNLLDGIVTAERGDISVAALRMGTPIIGTWNLEVTSERGPRTQRLKVLPDMSGWFGALRIDNVRLENDVPTRVDQNAKHGVTFRTTLKRGELTHEVRFSGEVSGDKLKGEITTPGGRARITGSRVKPVPRASATE